MPLIPGYNDDSDNIVATGDFLNAIEAKSMDILPFHQYGKHKWAAMGKTYALSDVKELKRVDCLAARSLMQHCAIQCVINIVGGD
jgi:pyruvate formate lyase activating enzyme